MSDAPLPQDKSINEAPATKTRSKKHWLAWLLVFLIVGTLLLPLLHHSAGPGGPGGPGGPPGGGPGGGTSVTVASVNQGSMDVFLDALGTVTPEHTINVYSQASGQVLAVHYREGQMVVKGQLLAEIDPHPVEAQLQQAMGTLNHDRAVLEQAKTDLGRYKTALAGNAIPEQTYYDQEFAVKQDEGTVQNDEGSVAYYKTQLGYCRIESPISGRIGLRLIDPGNIIFSGSSTTVATITQINPITVVFSVAEDHVQEVLRASRKAGVKVDIFDRSQLHKLSTGKLLTLDNQVDTTTGTVKLRALFDNTQSELFPNQFVNARLQIGTLQNALLIPTVAIQYNGQQAFVYVVKPDQTVALQNITVANSDQNTSAVSGLSKGDTVVTSNFDRLQDGAKVVLPQSMPATQPAGAKPAR